MGGALFIPFAFSVVLQQRLLLSECSVQTSPDTTFFPSNYLPYLFCMVPCRYGALSCIADFSSYKTLYAISVRQTRVLPAVSLFPHPATFRFAIACNTLAFGYLLPATGRIRNIYPLKMCAAGHTKKTADRINPSAVFWLLYFFKTQCLLPRLPWSRGPPFLGALGSGVYSGVKPSTSISASRRDRFNLP